MSELGTPVTGKGEKRSFPTDTPPGLLNMEVDKGDLSTSENGLLQVVLVSLQSLHTKFDTQLTQLEKDIHDPKNGIVELLAMTTAETEDNTSHVADINSRVNKLEQQVQLMADLLTKKDKEIFSLKSEITDIKSRSMRDNIVITGVKENTDENIRSMVDDLLQRIEVDKKNGNSGPISFDRIHRFGSRLANGTRPIVAKIHDFRDKVAILKNANKLKKEKLKDSEGKDIIDDTPPIFINEQFPEEIAEKRRQIYAKVRENKKNYQHTFKLK